MWHTKFLKSNFQILMKYWFQLLNFCDQLKIDFWTFVKYWNSLEKITKLTPCLTSSGTFGFTAPVWQLRFRFWFQPCSSDWSSDSGISTTSRLIGTIVSARVGIPYSKVRKVICNYISLYLMWIVHKYLKNYRLIKMS